MIVKPLAEEGFLRPVLCDEIAPRRPVFPDGRLGCIEVKLVVEVDLYGRQGRKMPVLALAESEMRFVELFIEEIPEFGRHDRAARVVDAVDIDGEFILDRHELPPKKLTEKC